MTYTKAPIVSRTHYRSFAAAPIKEIASPGVESALWLCSFTSFTMLMLIAYVGTIAAALFLAPWGLVAALKPGPAIKGVLRHWPLFLLPALALISTTWSDHPAWTFRASIQLILTIVVGIMAGCCVKPGILRDVTSVGVTKSPRTRYCTRGTSERRLSVRRLKQSLSIVLAVGYF